MKFILALASLFSIASAVPTGYSGNNPTNYGNSGCPVTNRAYHLRISAKYSGNLNPPSIQNYDGWFVSRRNDHAFGGNYDGRAWPTQGTGDLFYEQASMPTTLSTRDGWWLKFGSITQGTVGLVEYSRQKQDNPIVVGGNLAATYNRFGGWILCTSQYGPNLMFSIGPVNLSNSRPFPCGHVSIQLVPA